MLRIAIDSSDLYRGGSTRGLGRYTRTLLEVLRQDPDLSVAEVEPTFFTKRLGFRTLEWVDYPYRGVTIKRKDVDLYHATSVFNLARGHLDRTVCSVQDIIAHDLYTDARNKIKSDFFHAKLDQVPAIVASSDYTKSRIVDAFDVDPRRIFTASLPIRIPPEDELAASRPILEALPNAPFAVALFDITKPDPRKRLELTLEAAHLLSSRGIWTVLVGAGTGSLSDFPNRVLGLGRLSDDDMNHVYFRGVCYLYTTAYEGQGLPPQEAMAVGTPVVAMRNSSLPAMLGAGAEFVTDSNYPEPAPAEAARQLANFVFELAEDSIRRNTMSERARAHVAKFSVANFREPILESYKYCLD